MRDFVATRAIQITGALQPTVAKTGSNFTAKVRNLPSVLALIRAAVVINLITVVTVFDASLNDLIATTRRNAGIQTGVSLCLVPIIARFTVFHFAVATACCEGAIVEALITPIAVLARAHDAIATAGVLAGIGTRVRIDLIAIVALFRIFTFETLDSVAAAGPLAAVGAIVLIHPVTVVAGFAQIHAAIAAGFPEARPAAAVTGH